MNTDLRDKNGFTTGDLAKNSNAYAVLRVLASASVETVSFSGSLRSDSSELLENHRKAVDSVGMIAIIPSSGVITGMISVERLVERPIFTYFCEEIHKGNALAFSAWTKGMLDLKARILAPVSF